MTALPPVPAWVWPTLWTLLFIAATVDSYRHRRWVWGSGFAVIAVLHGIEAAGVVVPDGYHWLALAALAVALYSHKHITSD